MNIRHLETAIALSTLAACSIAPGAATPASAGLPAVPLATPAAQHLYIGDLAAGTVRAFALPLSATSLPVATVPVASVAQMTADGAHVATVDETAHVAIYDRPVAGSSAPAATFLSTGDQGMTFAPNGDLLKADGAAIDVFAPPFSDTSTPSTTLALPTAGIAALAAGADGTIYFAGGSSFGTVPGAMASTQIALPAGTAGCGVAVNATQLFVSSFVAKSEASHVAVYDLPLTAASKPVATITNGLLVPESIALDASGYLYAGNTLAGTVTVYAPPFSNASAPAVTYRAGGAIFGVAVGP